VEAWLSRTGQASDLARRGARARAAEEVRTQARTSRVAPSCSRACRPRAAACHAREVSVLRRSRRADGGDCQHARGRRAAGQAGGHASQDRGRPVRAVRGACRSATAWGIGKRDHRGAGHVRPELAESRGLHALRVEGVPRWNREVHGAVVRSRDLARRPFPHVRQDSRGDRTGPTQNQREFEPSAPLSVPRSRGREGVGLRDPSGAHVTPCSG